MLEEFESINLWWYSEDWENEDKHLKDWRAQEIRWVPSWINEISLKPFSLNFIMGPRQVGKTTGIKLLIKRLIESGVEPKRIIYLDVGLIPSTERLKKILFSLEEERFVFMDEVTSLEDWWKVLRACIDAGIMSKKVLVVTGSASLKLRKHAEFFPGRKGKGKILEVLPLSFPEFVRLTNKKKAISTRVLRKLFQEYKLRGGFPSSINMGEKSIPEIISAFKSEIVKAGLDLETSYQILHSLMRKIPSALSYQSIAGDIGISYKTVEHYLKTLKHLYFLEIAYWKEGGRVSFRREKKIFFRDPFIYRAFSFWTGERFLEGALYEGIVQEHMFRKFGEVYYHRNRYEIDCVAGDMKVEVKAGKPHRRYPRNVKILDEDDLPLFLVEMMG